MEFPFNTFKTVRENKYLTLLFLKLVFLPDYDLTQFRGKIFFGLTAFSGLEAVKVIAAMNPKFNFFIITSDHTRHSQTVGSHGHFKLVKAGLFVNHFGENQMILIQENVSSLAFTLEENLALAFAVVRCDLKDVL